MIGKGKSNCSKLAVLGIAVLLVSGCALLGMFPPDGDKGFELLKSDIGRSDPVDVPFTDVITLAQAGNEFAVDLYTRLKGLEGNLIFSPYSIFSALVMTYAGAAGDTEAEMEDVLNLTLGQDGTHEALNALDQCLAGSGDAGFLFKSANSIWGQEDMEFAPGFLDTLAGSYGAGLRVLDFITEPEKSRQVINFWVEEQTGKRIINLLPAGSITSATRMVLTNAVYFKAAWASQFNELNTTDKPFYLVDGSSVIVPMMRLNSRLGYGSGPGWTVVELPYEGRLFAMDLIIPDQFTEFEMGVSAGNLQAALDSITYTQVDIMMPKFSFERELELPEVLEAMGMTTAFTDQADLTRMYSPGNLYISEVRHKAFIDVNEEGTEAAAATAIGISLTSLPTEPVEVRVDHPFIFIIREIDTGTILFAGRVMHP